MNSDIGESRFPRVAPRLAEAGAVARGLSPRLHGCFALFGLGVSFAVTGGYSTTSIAFETSEYFPLATGDHWEYQVTVTGGSTEPVRAGSATVLDGPIPTRQVELKGFGESREFYTNDNAGLRLHRFDEGNTQHVFSPPNDNLGVQFAEGESVSSSGSFGVTFSNGATRGGSYESTARVLPSTSVTVPLGTFSAVPVEITIAESSRIEPFGGILVLTYKRNFWLARHIGPVRRFYVFRAGDQPPITYSGLLTSVAVDSDGDERALSVIINFILSN